MSNGTLEEIRDYVNEITEPTTIELTKLEKLCTDGRNRKTDPVPIYFAKTRIKKPESVFLKTKRKNKSYKELTDYAGIRLLCLFERDIIKIHDFLLNNLSRNDYDLYECNIYNFNEDNDIYYELKNIEEKYYPGHIIRIDDKISGYKSIHYLVRTHNSIYIEIQLRTLVQDVWGELEHALSYKKGNVHPHIRKSFYLLSKELQNIDDMLSYLKDIETREISGKIFLNYKNKPTAYIEYEDELLPKLFNENSGAREAYHTYKDIIKDFKTNNEWTNTAKPVLENLDKIINTQSEKESNTDYWIRMERAFLLFSEAEYDNALCNYLQLSKDYPDRYCIYYRIGELYFIKEQNEDALNFFDKAENLLKQSETTNCLNRYQIKARLAFTYWSLGEEYIHIALSQINDAESIYNTYKNTGVFKGSDYHALLNNLSWYSLERYIIALRNDKKDVLDKYFSEATRRFIKLEQLITDGNTSISLLDTAAWYYFQKFQRTKNSEFLKKSISYILLMKGKYSSNINYNSLNIHMNHIQEIMKYAQELGVN